MHQHTTGVYLCASTRMGYTMHLSVPPEKTAQIWEGRRSLARTPGVLPRPVRVLRDGSARSRGSRGPALRGRGAGVPTGERGALRGGSARRAQAPGQSRGSRRVGCPRLSEAPPGRRGPRTPGGITARPQGRPRVPFCPRRADPRGDPAADDALETVGGARFPGRRDRNRGARARSSLPAASRRPSSLPGFPSGSRSSRGAGLLQGAGSSRPDCGPAGGAVGARAGLAPVAHQRLSQPSPGPRL